MTDGNAMNGAGTIIGNDVEVVGTIKCNESIEINGKLNGDLNCSGDAVIGEKAVVQGNLSVNCVSVKGQITGNINAKDRIEMKSTARITGDIKSKRLTVVDGVTFIGKSEVNPSGAVHAAASKSAGSKSAEAADDTAADVQQKSLSR